MNWALETNIKGPKGDKGDPGADSTVPGPEGDPGPQGIPGEPGVASYGAVAPSTPVQGQLWWNPATKTLSVWDAGTWEPVLATWA